MSITPEKISQPSPAVVVTELSKPLPAAPPPRSPLSDFYVLWFIKNIPHHEFLVFEAPNLSFPEVIAKAKNYCELMRYRFIIVRPLVTDLAKDMMRERGER
jgi:hypothetical protein